MSVNGITKIMANGADVLARDLELRTAERDRALYLLVRLEKIANASGLCSPLDQAAVREARSLLVECGIVKRVGEELRAATAPAWASDPPPFVQQTSGACADGIGCEDPGCKKLHPLTRTP